MVLWCPVGQYLLFAHVFECPTPDLLDDAFKFFDILFGGHEIRSIDKYINRSSVLQMGAVK
jgi:hypothetical protein